MSSCGSPLRLWLGKCICYQTLPFNIKGFYVRQEEVTAEAKEANDHS